MIVFVTNISITVISSITIVSLGAMGCHISMKHRSAPKEKCPQHTCHILPPSEIDLGLCVAVFAREIFISQNWLKG